MWMGKGEGRDVDGIRGGSRDVGSQTRAFKQREFVCPGLAG